MAGKSQRHEFAVSAMRYAHICHSLLPIPSQLASVDTAIGTATEKLGESDELSQQIAELFATLTMLGIENPAGFGSMASLDVSNHLNAPFNLIQFVQSLTTSRTLVLWKPQPPPLTPLISML